jgi:hypothetical protein
LPPDAVPPEPLLVTLPFPTADPPLDEPAPDPVPQKSAGPFVVELPLPLVDEPVPDPVPQKSAGPFVVVLPLPLVDEPDQDPVPQKSTGPFVVELPLPLEDEPVPDPVPQKSAGPFVVELPLPLEDEPVPDPVPQKSAGPFVVELLLPLVDEPVPDPVPQKSAGPFDCEPPLPAVEPSVGLPPLKTIPGGEQTPGSNTAVVDPKPLEESCPNPASIARDSRRSMTGRSAEARGGFLVFRRFTGLLLGRPLRRGHVPLLGVQCRKSFQFRKGIGLGGGFRCAVEGHRIRVAALGTGSSPDDGGPATRVRPANGDEDCRSSPGTVRDRSSPSQASPSRSPHHGHDPSPDRIGQPVPDGGQLGHLCRDRIGLHDARRSLGLGGCGSGLGPAKDSTASPSLPPTLWPSGEPAVNDCLDTAAVVLGERAPVFDHVLEVGGKCAGICAAWIGDRGILWGKRG